MKASIMKIIPKACSKNEFKLLVSFLSAAYLLFLFFLLDQSSIPLSISFFTTLIFCYPIGYAILLPFKKMFNVSIFIKTMLYLGIGFLFSFLWSFFLSPYTVYPIAYFSLFSISIFIIFFNLYQNDSKIGVIKKQRFQEESINHIQRVSSSLLNESDSRFNIKKIDIYLFLLIGVSAIFIMWMFNTFEWWPPYGDYEGYGNYISIQVFNGSFTDEFPFLPNPEPIAYPLGLTSFPANLSIFYNITPAETILMLSGITMLLIIGTLISIVFTLTKSFWLASIILFSILNINYGDWTGNQSIWGQFTVGVAGNLVGFFSIFLLSLILLVIRSNNRSFPIFLALTIIAGVIVYPPTITYLFLIIVTFLISKISIKKNSKEASTTQTSIFSNHRKNFLNLSYFFIAIIIIGSLEGSLFGHIENVTSFAASHTSDYTMNFSSLGRTFLNDMGAISLFAGILSSLYIVIFLKKERFFGLFILSFIILGISGKYLGPFEFILSANRFFVIMPILSWIAISIIVYSTWKNKVIKKTSLRKYLPLGAFAILTLVLVLPDIPTIYENGTPTPWRRTADAIPYLDGMKWLQKNTNPNDIAFSFVDPEHYSKKSLDGRYFTWIQSISYRLAVNEHFKTTPINETKKLELNEAFSKFPLQGTLAQTLQENEIKYIIFTKNEERHKILQTYDFLHDVFRDDYTMVYRVLHEKLPNKEEAIKLDLAYVKNWEMEGNFQESFIFYDKITRFDPASFEGWSGKIRMSEKLNEYDETKSIYDDMIFVMYEQRKLYSHDIDKWKLFNKYYHEVLEGKATLAKNFGEYKDALKAYDTIIFDKRIDAEALIKKAEVLEKMREYIQAREIYTNLLIWQSNNEMLEERIEEIDKKL